MRARAQREREVRGGSAPAVARTLIVVREKRHAEVCAVSYRNLYVHARDACQSKT